MRITLRTSLFALLLIGYLGVSHGVLATPGQHAGLGIVLALLPPTVAATLFCLASGHRRWAWLPAVGAAMLLWLTHERLAAHFAWLYFLQDTGTQLCLAMIFGRTLLAGQQPLCTQVAALIHGALDASLACYTRQVTVAWTVFFTGMTSLSILLFWLAPLAIWSAFSNLLLLPLTGLMFIVEYAIRRYRLPHRRAEMRFTDTFRAYATLHAKTSARVVQRGDVQGRG